MSNNSTITHKELLTFSNLTNLDWQYGKLMIESESTNEMQLDSTEPRFKKLNDLLTPKSFIKRDEEGNFEEYVYMKEVKIEEDISQYNMEHGLVEMWQAAGIAMEYLEK